MTLTFISLIIGFAAVVTFLIGGGRRGWVLFAAALLLIGAGAGGVVWLEKGSQQTFARP